MTTHSDNSSLVNEVQAWLQGNPNAIRVCEGGGPENLAASFVLTMAATERKSSKIPQLPTEVVGVAWRIVNPDGLAMRTQPYDRIGDAEKDLEKMNSQYRTPWYRIQPLYTHPAPAAVDGKTQEYTLRAMAMNYSGGHSWDHLDSDACRNGADEIASLRALLATANSAEGKVVPEAVIIDAMEHLPNNREATRHEMIRAFALALSATAREKMVVDEELTKDAARWRYLVAENNKGGLHGKYLICWYDEKGEGYCSTNGVSVNGKDDQAIVRIIDAAMLNATASKES